MRKRIVIKRSALTYLLMIVIGISLALLIFFMVQSSSKTPHSLTMIEDSQLRTGSNSAYPVIFDVKKGDSFKILERQDKWFYVENKDHKKGWIAGWHTNLNIPEDKIATLRPLKGKSIIIDAGHGGEDVGASSPSGTREKDITLKTALMLRDKLKAAGANVKMTRSDDTYVKLKDRKGVADAFISIHSDALDDSSPHGLTVYFNKESQKPLADTLHLAIKKKTLLSDRGVRQENYQVIRQTKIPAVLLELGYISNPTDEHLMNDKIFRQTVTTAIVDGLSNYFLY